MIPASESVKLLTSSLKGMKLSASEAISVVDKLTKLDMKSATSAQELAQALSKVANSARLAKVSQDEILSILSVGIETTQQSGDVIGTAVRSLLARFSNVKASKFGGSGEETEGTLNDTEAVLSKIGIRIRNASGEMRSFMDVLDDVAEKWDTLDDVSRNAISTAMAGTRQKEIFASIIENYDRVKELIGESANAAGTANEKYSAYMDSMEAATKRLQNAWEGFAQSLGTSTLIKDITNLTALFTENAIEGVGWLKQLMPLLLTLQSGSIIGAITDPGETGGFRGLLRKIPVIGGFVKSNDAIQQIAKDVHEIKEETAGSAAKTKNGSALKKIWQGLTGRQDIVDPETGKSISYNDLKFAKKLGINAQNSVEYAKYAKLLTKRQIGNAAFGGISSALAQLATTKDTGSGVGGAIGKFLTGNTGNEQTIEETSGGKALRTLASGGLAALGGAFFGPLGAMLGQTIGEGVASIVSTIVHRSELEMKQRVADAKERLNVLQNIQTISEDGNLIMSEKFLDSSGYEQLNKYVESLVSELSKLDSAVSDKVLKTVRDTGKTTADTISQLGDDILKANPEDRKEIQKALKISTLEEQYNQKLISQEFERHKADALAVSVYAVEGTLEEKLANAQFIVKELGELDDPNVKYSMKAIEKYVKELKEAVNIEAQLDKELRNSQIQIAYLKSGISDLTQNELADLTINGVAGRVVKSLEDMGIAVRDASGVIKSEYLTQIKAMIKADSDMAILTKGDTKRIGELETAWNNFIKVFGEAPGIYDKVREALEKGRFEEYLNENKIQGSAEALEKLVYAANPERIEQFASAWNMTVEAALELAKVMPNLTTATGLMSTTEISEKMSKISAIFSDLSKDGRLTIENFNAILKNYPEYVDQLGDYEALLGSLGKTLTDESLFSYQNALFSSLMSDEGYYKKFMAQLPEDLNKLLTGTNSKTLTDVLNLAQTDEDFADLNDELQKFLDKTYELEVDNPLRDLAIEVREGLLDKQISNLNEQKEALSKINDERKKELEYIKAKIALEDAQKEKKRVYRAGIGWTYESDETAISEAREKLESLDIERQQDSIQLQIDSLSQQKEILEAIKNNEQLEAIEKALGENGISTNVEDIAAWVTGVKFNPATKQYEEFTKAQEQKRVNAVKNLDELYKSYEAAVSTMNSEWSKAGIKGQQKLVGDVKHAYNRYSEAYTTASGLGADVSDYSENGKIKPNAADSKGLDRAKFIQNVEGFKPRSSKVSFQFDGVDYSDIRIKENGLSERAHNKLNDLVKQLVNREKKVGDLVYLNGHLYIRRRDGRGDRGWGVLTDDTAANQIRAKYFLAKGSLSSQGGLTMLNEFGTEGIITPGGTLTALPSKSGVVPADITKNVWALGEVAPTLVAQLSSLTQKALHGNVGNTTYEEGQYFDNFVMNVYPEKGDDFEKILEQARAKMNLTRRNN